jgi:hypothetical protein
MAAPAREGDEGSCVSRAKCPREATTRKHMHIEGAEDEEESPAGLLNELVTGKGADEVYGAEDDLREEGVGYPCGDEEWLRADLIAL